MCDTFVVLPPSTADGAVLFGKNSDREPNEAQALEYHPPRTYADGETVSCTYVEIPQSKETYGVLLSRPFWMWGAEMGANEKGVVIGNEAVWTKMPLDRKGGLTGMDLLRLALERASSAGEAVETVVRLLSDYGQGGICGYEDRRMTYHNSFIMADSNEAWVLETAGPLWAGMRVKEFYVISNGLTIGEEFDVGHPALVETARRKGWLKKRTDFHFARCFSDWFYTTFSGSHARRSRMHHLINETRQRFSLKNAFDALRDHEGDGYRPDSHLLGNRLCAHAANKLTRNATQSTGSLVAHLDQEVRTIWATGTSAPCTGIFKPIWFEGKILPDLGPTPGGRFDPDSLWWRHERLHRSVLADYTSRLADHKKERDALEKALTAEARNAATGGRWAVTDASFRICSEATDRWISHVAEVPVSRRPKSLYRRFWDNQNRKAGLIVQ